MAVVCVSFACRAEAQTIGAACAAPASAGSPALIQSSSTGDLLICNGTTWVLAAAITTGGFVGIGTNTPSTLLQVGTGTAGKLSVNSQDNGFGQLQIGNSTSNSEASIGFLSGVTAFGSSATSANGTNYEWALGAGTGGIGGNKFGIYNVGLASNAIVVQSDGKVGIANTSPGALLDVGLAGTTLGTMRLEGNTSGYVQLQTAAAAGSWTMTLPPNAGTNTYVLQTNGSGVTSWVAAGTGATITLGASATTTNPQVSGDATTGFYTSSAGHVDVSAGGTQIVDWSSVGQNIVTGSLKLAGVNGLWQDNTNFNTAVGDTALPTNVSQSGGGGNGQYNFAVGYAALNVNTTGQQNTAVGADALLSNTTGYENTAVGTQALQANTTGYQNTAVGFLSLVTNTTGVFNTAAGAYALYLNTTGSYNTAMGYGALVHNTTGINNTAVGMQVLYANTTGVYNTAVGYQVLYANTTGVGNTAVGYGALYANTTGSSNTAMGNLVGSTTLATGYSNILIGTSSAVDTTAAGTNYNLNIGNLLQGDMTNSTGLGKEALYLQSTASSVDYLQIAGGATGNPGTVTVSGQGTDANVNIELLAKGTGNVGIGTTSPGALLDMFAAIPVGRLNSTDANNYSRLMFAENGTSEAWIQTIGSAFGSGRSGNLELVSKSDISFWAGNSTQWVTFKSGGNVGIGTASPVVSLDLSQKTDALALPSGLLSQRPSGVNGEVRYSQTDSALEAYVNGAWEDLITSGGSTSGINLGTSAAATNPHRTSDTTTGLFSAAVNTVSVAAGGADVVDIGTNGINIANGVLTGASFTSNFLNVTGTLPASPTFIASGVYFDITGAGSTAVQQIGLRVALEAGDTGNTQTDAVYAKNLSAGTGAGPFAVATANYGGNIQAIGTTAGNNIGVIGVASGSSVLNFGSVGKATGASSLDIGVTGAASGGTLNVGGFFTLTTSASPTASSSAALIADNGTTSSPIFVAQANGSPVVTIGSTGNVGIGTTAPGSKLDVRDGAVNLYSNLQNTNASDDVASIYKDGTNSYYVGLLSATLGTSDTFAISRRGSSNQILVMNSAGNVGIGTTAPTAVFDVRGAIQSGDGTIQNVVSYADHGDGRGVVAVLGTLTNQPAELWTNGVQRLVIKTDGNVGIGTTTPQSKLDVNGNITIGSYAGATAAPSNSMIISGTVAIGTSAETTGTALDLGTNTNSMLLPVGTTGQRPTGVNGMLRYNSTVPQVEAYYSGGWNALGGGSATINLGTSASVTNPQRSGQATTGFYSDTTNVVEVAAGGIEAMQWNTIASGVDYLSITPGKSGTAPVIAAAGSTTTQHINLAPKGVTGVIQFGGNTMLWQDTTNSNTVVGATALVTAVSQAGGGTNGQDNTAVGFQALNLNTTGQQNSALGAATLQLNTTGQQNTAIGYAALGNNTTGQQNTGVGEVALYNNTTGLDNVALGQGAAYSNTGGSANTAFGQSALFANTTGSNNLALGNGVASTTLTTGSNNILIGTSNAVTTTAAGTNYNLNIGNLLQGDMTNSTGLGKEALYLQSTASSVDYLQIAGGATGNPGTVTVSGQGTDTSVNIALLPKGVGYVGIGITGPSQPLEISTTSSDYQIRLGEGTIGSSITYDIGRNRSDGLLYLFGNQTGYTGYVFGGIDGERMRISSTGKVGIGTTTPQSKLDVNGNITIGSYAGATAAPANSMIISGTVAIGTSAETTGTALDLGTNTNSMLLPTGTTGQRPTGINGMLRYNSTVPQVEAYYSGGWNALGAGSVGTLTLGTSASVTSPQRTGDATTGFYSAAVNTVAVAAGGIEAEQWNTAASGNTYVSITPGITAAPTIGVGGTSSGLILNAGTGALTLETTGSNAAVNITPNGTGSVVLTSGATTGTGATAAMQLVANSLTTGNGLDASTSSLTTGNLVKLASTGTVAGSNTQTVLNIATSGTNGTSAQTTYGAQITNTHAGTTSTDIGLYATASGGTTNNFAIEGTTSGTTAGDSGVWGYASGASGATYGVYGQSANTAGTGYGVYSKGNLGIAPPVSTSGSSTALTLTGAANTGQTASTEAPDVNFNLARTVTFATGAIATQRAVQIQVPTYAFVGASTITNAATVDISGPPVAGTNATITNPAALVVESGNVGIGTASPGYPLTVNGTINAAKVQNANNAAGSGFVTYQGVSGGGATNSEKLIYANTDGLYPIQIDNYEGDHQMLLTGNATSNLSGLTVGSISLDSSSGVLYTYGVDLKVVQDSSESKGYFYTTTSGINFDFRNRVATNIPIVVEANGSQTADLQQWWGTGATEVAGVKASGGAYFAGNVGIGTTSPNAGTVLDLGSNTTSLLLPTGTTGQRPTATAGMIRYNSTTPGIEAYYNSVWNTLGGGAAANYSNLTGNSNNATVAANSTVYGPASGSFTMNATYTAGGTSSLVSRAATIQNLYYLASAANGSGKTNTITVYKNGSATALTCSVTNVASCQDTTHTFSVVAGDALAAQIVTQAGSTVVTHSWSIELSY